MDLTLQVAKDILHANMQNVNLRRHCYAVGYALRAYYDYYLSQEGCACVDRFAGKLGGLTADQWQSVGILHDSDWELTTPTPNKHTLVLIDWLKAYNTPEEMLDVFKSHNTKLTNLREPQTLLEWTLECCDELTGFIVAVTLVRPDKKLESVDLSSVVKKFKQKEFARAVDRSQIAQCEEKLGIPLDKFVSICLDTMKAHASELGL